MTTLAHEAANAAQSELKFTGERIVPEAQNCEPRFAQKMYQEHIARYLFAAQVCKGKHVLDVACGVGYGSQILAKSGAASVTAFDLSADAIAHARRFYQHEALDFHVASADTFDFKRTFDVITCFEMIEHVENQEEVLKRVAAHLSPTGVIFISTPRALDKPRSAFHTREFTLNEYSRFLKRALPNVAFYVENNHFCSLVTEQAPDSIDRITVIEPKRMTAAAADYFVAVAGRSELPKLDAQLTLNTDDYVTMLEHDVEILRQAETDARAELTDRQREVATTTASLEQERATSSASKLQLGKVQKALTTSTSELSRTRAELEETRALAKQREADLSDQLAALQGELAVLRTEHDAVVKDLKYTTSSLSWNATKPLRAARERLGPLASVVKGTAAHLRSEFKTRVQRMKPLRSDSNTVAPPPAPAEIAPAFDADVLFFVGCHEGESKRYRVHNIIEGLHAIGTHGLAFGNNSIPDVLARGFNAKAVVLFRLAYNEDAERLIARAKAQKVPVFFDVDDLVFEPESIDNVRAIKTFTAQEREHYLDGVRRYRQTLMACDYAIAPTEFLRQRIEALGKPAFVVPNTINSQQISVSERVRHKHAEGPVHIAYFSGSNTHQADFAQCEAALLKILATYPNTHFVLVGYLDLSKAWKKFEGRVKRVGFQPYLTMLETLGSIDINLAPLEVGNPYCESKSQLKIFEAGLVSVPTVASPTGPYTEAITHERDGMLVEGEREWFAALERLVKDTELRRTLGQNARVRALQQFGVSTVAQRVRDTYLAPNTNRSSAPQKRTSAKSLQVGWIVPHLPKGSGGHRNILRVAYHLKQFGHDLSLYFIDTNDTSEQIAKTVVDHYYPLDCPIQRYEGQIEPVDVLFATHWSTVRYALAQRAKARRLAYFVQDFEPLFHPMGTDYILAENTYRQGLYHITSGPWCAHILRTQFNVQAESFLFPIDRSIYYPRERQSAGPRVLFFGRPEMPRRCFELGLVMLEKLHAIAPEVEIVMYGSGELAQRTYPFKATIHGMVPDIDGLAHLYSNADVGVAFSTTNPSLVPYEMMACGLPVVDLSRQGAEISFGGRFDIALLADPDPEAMARQIAELLKNPAELKARRRNGLEFASTLPDEEQMVRRVESLITGLVD